MSLSYEGIGASLQMIDDYVTIMEILPGGSAQKSGELKATDRIIAVGQGKSGEMVDVVGWRLDDVVQLIRGPLARSCGCRSSPARPRRMPPSACWCCPARRSRWKPRRHRRSCAPSSAATGSCASA